MRRTMLHCILMQIVAAASGCAPSFALKPVNHTGQSGGEPEVIGYDSNGDGEVDFRTVYDPAGRIAALIYGQGPQAERIELADIPPEEKRHLVIVLDGVGYGLAKEFYEAGHLRYCAPPSRVIAPYPTLTDLSLNDALAAGRSSGFEALYYDAQANKLAGGSWAYLRGENMPYNALLDYRADLLTDALSYLFPWHEFKIELAAAQRKFAAWNKKEFIAYFVSMAGLGTRNGAEGHRRALAMLDRLVLDALWESRGRVQVTLFSDHGHSYTVSQRAPIEQHLEDRGWRVRETLEDPRDVVYIRFGLETYASFATQSPAELAADLVAVEGVEIASFSEGNHVVVLGPDGQRAHVREVDGEYAYEQVTGDPLKYGPILDNYSSADGLQRGVAPAAPRSQVVQQVLHHTQDKDTEQSSPDATDTYPADWLLEASATHEYPAPLQRLWRAHRGDLAANTPDVIISLGDAWYSGSKGFAGAVEIESTHGGLNYANSATFIMSSLGKFPDVLRSRDIPAHMAELLNVPAWPLKRIAGLQEGRPAVDR